MVKGGYVLNLIHKYCVHHSPIVKCENMCGHMRARVRQCIHACLFICASKQYGSEGVLPVWQGVDTKA